MEAPGFQAKFQSWAEREYKDIWARGTRVIWRIQISWHLSGCVSLTPSGMDKQSKADPYPGSLVTKKTGRKDSVW